MNTFSYVGYLRPIKDSENRKSFSVTHYDSGWMSERLRFIVQAGDNTQFVEINAGRWVDENKNVIYGMTRSENGKKGESFQVPWSQRNDPTVIDKMAGWKIYTVDLDTKSHRSEIEKSGDTEALAASKKKEHHFLAPTEFCEYVNRVVNSDKIKNIKFRVNGNINYTYSSKDDRYYSTYEVTKIYKVDDDVDIDSSVNIDFFYTENAMDCEDYSETGKAIVSGYTQFYDNNTKKSWFCPIVLAMRCGTDEAGKKKIKGWKKVFSKFEDDEVRKMGLACQQINGSSRAAVTYEDLSEDTREFIDLGLISLEDAIRDVGGSKVGDKIQEIRIEKPGRGFSTGSEPTTYEVADLIKKPIKETSVDSIVDDDDEDIL